MSSERTPELSGLRVLYVEDSETDADLARLTLARIAPDIVFEIAHGVGQALERIAQPQGLDVILTDLKLPDGSGLELLADIRMRQLPLAVVLLTGSGDQNAAISALKSGADAYLVKHGSYLSRLPETLHTALARFHRSPARPLRRLRVLYAQHDEFDAGLTQRHLARHHPHIQLTTAHDATDVLAQLPADGQEPHPFDVLLLDYGFDGSDSLELARVVRERQGPTLPIVLATARTNEEIVARALDAGVTDFIVRDEGYLQVLPATLEKVREQAELQHEKALLREATTQLSHLLTASPVILYTLRMCDGSFIPTWVSDNIERIFGSTPEQAIAPGWWLYHLHPGDRAAALAAQPRLLKDGHLDHEYRFVSDSGLVFWVRDQMRLAPRGAADAPEVIGIWTDITREKREALFQNARSAVLNRLVAGDPLPAILEEVVDHLERIEPSMRGSILLLDPSSGRLMHGVAPRLPDYYRDAVEGLEPGEGQGSCGTAVFRGEAVFAGDVATDPSWARYRDIAARVGFRACWSLPFRAADEAVLGTFAAYFDTPREPEPALVGLIEEFCALTALAVQTVRANAALRQAAAVIDSTRDGVMITDLDRRIVSVNRAWCEMTGYSAEEALGKVPQMLKSGLQDDSFYRRMWSQIANQGYWQGEIWNRRRNGELYPEWLSISTVYDDNRPTHYVGVMTDVSKLRKSEAQLERLAHFDPLTDLPNRLLVQSRLEHAIEQAARHGSGIGVLFIDLDRFKTVNDSLGHAVGDALLKSIALRLREGLRTEDTLARWGGDEFLIVIENVSKPDESASVAQGLIDRFQEPFELPNGQQVYVGTSIGISLYPQDARSAAPLIQHADTALNQAKAQGRNTYRFFTDAMTRVAQLHLDLERRLRRALEQQAFVVHYQPQVDIASGRMTGCEALLRWNDPEEGLIAPNHFIPFAEETGLIVPIGEWALETACEQARRWLDAGLPTLRMAVNLSARQLWQSELPERIAEILARTRLPPGSLELELTESMIMGHEPEAVERLGRLCNMRLRLALDDFGTGYSSLSYLKNLPIEVLKIDQSFVRNIPHDRNDMEIAAGIIALARKLNLQVLAEGVETAEQLAFLREQGCDSYQGYLFSRPLPVEQFEKLLV